VLLPIHNALPVRGRPLHNRHQDSLLALQESLRNSLLSSLDFKPFGHRLTKLRDHLRQYVTVCRYWNRIAVRRGMALQDVF
jgi:hypothetical protein